MGKTLDPTKPVQTRDGRPARILAADLAIGGGTRIAAAVMQKAGFESTVVTDWLGRVMSGCETAEDLVNIPEKFEGWVNVYPSDRLSNMHKSRESADNAAGAGGRIACIPISFTAGEGL